MAELSLSELADDGEDVAMHEENIATVRRKLIACTNALRQADQDITHLRHDRAYLLDRVEKNEREIARLMRYIGGLLEIGVRLLIKDDGGWLLVNDRAEKAEAALVEMRPIVDAAQELQALCKYIPVEECVPGWEIGAGNRLATALARHLPPSPETGETKAREDGR